MYYINKYPNETGNHGNPVSNQAAGMVALPGDFLSAYIAAKGFVYIQVEDGTVTSLETNQEALAAYEAAHPEAPEEAEPSAEEILNTLLGVAP
ncbi:MAG: hypothetical protein MR419_06675 [Clostridiales bacterium]|nr:hypothetical protein [Clostridiales bacterium]MDY4171939.1 hypothetical protein [Evtepia sp.]